MPLLCVGGTKAPLPEEPLGENCHRNHDILGNEDQCDRDAFSVNL